MEQANTVIVRECETLDELSSCVRLQREVFALPEIEISPVRHFIVTRNAGGFTLGAFERDELVGFVLSVPAFLRGRRAFYSHMTAVRVSYQGSGIGARLKWEQRARSLAEGVKFIKWTFEPVKSRNAYFNLEKLGACVREIEENFYGTDYITSPQAGEKIGLLSDRLFAEWELDSPKVVALARGGSFSETNEPEATISVAENWSDLVKNDPATALTEQRRIRSEFQQAFKNKLVARRFQRASLGRPASYVLYRDQ